MILEQETFEAYGYYSKDLTHESHKNVIAACDLCGKFRVTSKYAYRTFCHSCSMIFGGKVKGENAPNWKGRKKERICEFCGEIFYAFQSNID